jgi:hypothetical protein
MFGSATGITSTLSSKSDCLIFLAPPTTSYGYSGGRYCETTFDNNLNREEITDWLNEIKDDMVNRIIDCNEKYFNTMDTLSVDANGEADLNGSFRKFQQVAVLYDGANGRLATHVDIDMLDDHSMTIAQSTPVYFFKDYKIGIRPKGTSGTTTIEVKYEKQPQDLSNDSDELPRPLRFYMRVIMHGLMSFAMEKAGKLSRAKHYDKKYEDGIELMIEEINGLVLNENRIVRDEIEDEVW